VKHGRLLKAELKWQEEPPHLGFSPSQSAVQGQEYEHGFICHMRSSAEARGLTAWGAGNIEETEYSHRTKAL